MGVSSTILRPVSRNSRKLFGPQKPFLKVRPAYSVKLVFSYVVKGIKTKIIEKFRASGRLRFETYTTRNAPEKFWHFRETGAWTEIMLTMCRNSYDFESYE